MLSEDEICAIAKNYNDFNEVADFELKKASDKVLGYLGEHLTLRIQLKNKREYLTLFVKCLPRKDALKAEYITKCNFFKKEYEMLAVLFKNFGGDEGSDCWRPKSLLLKENIFVFEDMTTLGYCMPNQQKLLSLREVKCIVKTIAQFHASSYIFEEKIRRQRESYQISDDHGEFLHEQPGGFAWRKTGLKAIIDVVLELSRHKYQGDLKQALLQDIPKLYEEVVEMMKPSKKYRNVVVHRDLWTNNILLKYSNGEPVHAVIVDFQTVLYTSPLLDLSSMLCFTTDLKFRKEYTEQILLFYYCKLKECLDKHQIDITRIMTKRTMFEAYEDSVLFGLTQACLIVPLVAMNAEMTDHYFNNTNTFHKVNEVSRTEEFLEIASLDNVYKNRILELFEELVDRYVDVCRLFY